VRQREIPARLKSYFAVPSAAGFSPYRTGQTIQLLFSGIIGQVTWLALERTLDPHWGIIVGGVFAGVLALWGIGVRIGIHSHYNPLLALFVFIVFMVGVLKFPAVALPGLAAGLLSHVFVMGVLRMVVRRKA
jgi:hypothetical protein